MRIPVVAFVGFGLLFMGAAQAQQNPPQQTSSQKAADPNEKICEDVVQTGSRLASKRICATRSEWEDKRRQDREAVEKAQLSPCVIQTTNATGKPSC